MGLIFGKISVETPKYEVIKSTSEYEIRKYAPSVVAEVTYDPSQFKGNKDGGFTVLANYIGALGNPQNTKPEKIAMTAPVITKDSGEKIAMTAPVVTKDDGEEGKDKRVTMQEKVEKLRMSLEKDGFKVVGDFLLARYNPPWTIPALRTNEVMIPVE
uniref:Heme-binding-like protein At3g10130, chloroplastic n=1 Tax=Cajanus cajan TaxID=3821 RepID=A0A151TKY0_CAJCA|nr:hypothetical protein KK1_024055 [Cajanus cajan]